MVVYYGLWYYFKTMTDLSLVTPSRSTCFSPLYEI